ncbi:peptidase M24A, methionine aminopeptidase, subfamily 2, partial [Kipferlia bialata]
PYQVHAGQSIPNCKKSGNTQRMKVGEVFALETFASTGRGYVRERGDASHFMLAEGCDTMTPAQCGIKLGSARKLMQWIQANHRSLAWTQRWFDRAKLPSYEMAMTYLVNHEVVNPYPPLADVRGCYTSQFEHTFLITDKGKEVLSRGDDY